MAVAGNTSGAGGAKNIARAQRFVKTPAAKPSSRPTVNIQGATVAYGARPPTPMQMKAARAQQAAYASQGQAVEKAANKANAAQAAARAAAQAASERKRASRVAVSAQRKQTGSGRPILVNRRANLAALDKAYAKAPVTPVAERQIKAKGTTVKQGPQPLTSVPMPREHKVQEQNITREAKSKGAIFSMDPEVLKRGGFHEAGVADKLAALPLTAAAHAPRDAAELAMTTPTSLAHLATTAATHPKKLPGELIAPYKEFAKDPIKFAGDRPVTTYLMFSPTAKVPGRVLGKAARVAGRQTLERAPAVLPGTSLKQVRVGSRDMFKRAKQSRQDAAQGQAIINPDELARRVDEHKDSSAFHKQHVKKAAADEANRRFSHLPKAQRDTQIADHISGAVGDANRQVKEQFVKEFGSHWQRNEHGVILKPKNAPENSGHLHANREDAQAVAARVPFDAKVYEVPGRGDAPSRFGVVPKEAADRLAWHGRVGKSNAPGAVGLRVASRLFRQTVLPFSPKWLGGQVGEGALRAAAAGAGPTSLIRGIRVLRQMERDQPGSARAVTGRTTQTGQFGLTGPAKEFADGSRTLAEEFAQTGPRLARGAQKLTDLGAKPGIRHVRAGFHRYSHFVFHDVNARVEELAKKAMLGKAISKGPLMEGHLHTLSDAAIRDAARGLRGTSAQVELGRAVDRAYGRYSKFSPAARETLMHSTPFFPWFRNMAHFLFKVMPEDHPIKTALVAAYADADTEWRKAQGVSLYGKNQRPGFMFGTYPSGKSFYPVGRFGPFLPGEPVSAVGGQLLPQLQGMILNAAGADWKGDPIKGAGTDNLGQQGNIAANVGLTGAETFVPGVSQLDRLTGLGDRYVRGKKDKESVVQGKKLSQAALDLVNPVKPIKSGGKKKRKASGPGPTIVVPKIAPIRIKPIR